RIDFPARVAPVAPGAGNPSSPVYVQEGSVVYGQGVLSNRQATVTVIGIPAGTHSLTAVYPGDLSFKPSTPVGSVTRTVNKNGTTMTLSATQASLNAPVVINVTVRQSSPGLIPPDGTVNIYGDGALIATPTLSINS